MVSKKIVIDIPTGLNLRPAGNVCKVANRFVSTVNFNHRGQTSNAKSVLSVLGAGILHGDEVEFICEGPDETAALTAILALAENGFEDEG